MGRGGGGGGKCADGLSRGLEKSKKWIIQTHHLECKRAYLGSHTLPLWTGPTHRQGPPAAGLHPMV